MKPWAFCLLFCLCGLLFPHATWAQQEPDWVIDALGDNGAAEWNWANGLVLATNGIIIKYGGAVLTAQRVQLNQRTGEAQADGDVRIQREAQLWVGEHILYNFKDHSMEAEQFRTGRRPVFASGFGLSGSESNKTYFATNALITTDDSSHPLIKVRARHMRIVPGQRFEARDATLYVGEVPIFFFPYYSRNLGPRANNFNFLPGYRSTFGPFLLGTYNWFLNDELDGQLHVDYRERRGLGVGPDINYKLGEWGNGTFRYYYTDDANPDTSFTNNLPHHRDRIWFSYQNTPMTNLEVRAMARYESDLGVAHDFFESEYRQNPQPSTYVNANKFWHNFSLDAVAQPRVNSFLETVERLPDIRLTGYRQQIGATPVYYESQSSAGYYRRLFPDTNGLALDMDYAAARADSYHQLLLPETFFGWLNVTPRVGGRFTYYSHASGPGAVTDEIYRGVFNTGAEISFKASRLWPEVKSKLLDLDGVRHIVEPSVNYAFVPDPAYHGTNQPPLFDYVAPSFRLLPIDFPEYDAIDQIDSQNVLRLGMRNRLQTKRLGAVVNLLEWDLYTDWRVDRQEGQNTFSDVYSDLVLRPREWIVLESITRFEPDRGDLRMSYHTLTLQPNDVWSISLGHFFLRDDFGSDPTALGQGNDLFTSSLFYRLNENYGFRATHRYEARDGRLEEQFYTVYRDFRSWTSALTLRVRDNRVGRDDVTVAVTFSLKSLPRYPLGADTVRPYTLLGY